jgi:hypothetical protein
MKNFIAAVKQEVSNLVAVVAAGQGHAVVAAVHHAAEAEVAAEAGAAVGRRVVAAGVPAAAEVRLRPGARAATAATVTEGRKTRKKSSDPPAVLMKIEGKWVEGGMGGSEIFDFKTLDILYHFNR